MKLHVIVIDQPHDYNNFDYDQSKGGFQLVSYSIRNIRIDFVSLWQILIFRIAADTASKWKKNGQNWHNFQLIIYRPLIASGKVRNFVKPRASFKCLHFEISQQLWWIRPRKCWSKNCKKSTFYRHLFPKTFIIFSKNFFDKLSYNFAKDRDRKTWIFRELWWKSAKNRYSLRCRP